MLSSFSWLPPRLILLFLSNINAASNSKYKQIQENLLRCDRLITSATTTTDAADNNAACSSNFHIQDGTAYSMAADTYSNYYSAGNNQLHIYSKGLHCAPASPRRFRWRERHQPGARQPVMARLPDPSNRPPPDRQTQGFATFLSPLAEASWRAGRVGVWLRHSNSPRRRLVPAFQNPAARRSRP